MVYHQFWLINQKQAILGDEYHQFEIKCSPAQVKEAPKQVLKNSMII